MKRTCFASILTACTASLLAVSAHAQLQYRLTLIEDPNNPEPLQVQGLNNKAEVAGFVGDFGGRAFLWKQGVYTDMAPLIDPAAAVTSIAGINDRSDMAGSRAASADGESSGFLFANGVRIDMNIPNVTSPGISDVNDRRQVIGKTPDGRPFIWRNGTTTFLPQLPGTDFGSTATRINDRGVVTGMSGAVGSHHAVIWKNGTVADLGVLPGGSTSEGADVNNWEQVVGRSMVSSNQRAFIWSRGEMRELPLLRPEHTGSQANAINDWAAIVGSSDEGSNFTATLWIAGDPLDLNALIRDNDPLKPYITLVQAIEINDRGFIVASGRDSRSPNLLRPYLLTPSY